MKVSFLQYDVKKDKNLNYKTIEDNIKLLESDIIILPELCNCGYLFENKQQLKSAAEHVPNGDFVAFLKNLSKKYSCAIVAGIAEFDSDKIYNTAVIVDRGIYVGKYRKIHLTDLEKTLFTRGKENIIFNVMGIKIGVQICFDLWFPEISREQMLQSADLLCVLANFGGEATYQISKIRAMENLTPLVLCNRVGTEIISTMKAVFLGKSSIISFSGERLVQSVKNTKCVLSHEVLFNHAKTNEMCKDFNKEIFIHPIK